MSKHAIASSHTIIKIQFYDMDPMNIAWHGNYVRFFEQARCDLLDKIGYNYQEMLNSGYSWPVIDLHIRYIKPLLFNQEVVITASLVEYENRLKIDYLVCDKQEGTRLSKGSTIQVAVDLKTKEMLLASPPVLAQKLGIAS